MPEQIEGIEDHVLPASPQLSELAAIISAKAHELAIHTAFVTGSPAIAAASVSNDL